VFTLSHGSYDNVPVRVLDGDLHNIFVNPAPIMPTYSLFGDQAKPGIIAEKKAS